MLLDTYGSYGLIVARREGYQLTSLGVKGGQFSRDARVRSLGSPGVDRFVP